VGLFTNKATQLLGNIFNFRDGRANISSVDLSGPIQPVFDLSRGTGLARSSDFGTSMGLVGLQHVMVHAGAGDLFNESLDIYAVEAAFFRVPVDALWIWVMDVEFFTTNNSYNSIQASVRDPDIQGTPVTEGRLLAWADAASLPFELGGDLAARADGQPVNMIVLPYLLTPGSDLQTASRSSGAVTMTTIWRIWVGPRYASPPGVS